MLFVSLVSIFLEKSETPLNLNLIQKYYTPQYLTVVFNTTNKMLELLQKILFYVRLENTNDKK
jgi:hypothetical protein